MDAAWVIDESSYAGREHLDPDFVAGYDRKQGHPGFDEDFAALREHGVLTAGATIVDLGAGTGRFALGAAPHCARVVAVDISPAMVRHLRRAVADAGASNIEVIQAGFLSYQHAGAPADAIYCRNALHQLPDFWKGIALQRAAQALRAGGVLRLHDIVYDFNPAEAPSVLHRWMGAAATDQHRGYTADDFATHIRSEFSTYRWLLEPLLHAAGFVIIDTDVRRQLYATYTCLKR